jgi:hypothetical protein
LPHPLSAVSQAAANKAINPLSLGYTFAGSWKSFWRLS